MQEEDATRGGCRMVEPLLSSYAAGALDEESERQVRDHLFVCAACRAAQMERDPSVLFLELRRVPLRDGFLDGLAADVRRRLESGRRRWLFLDRLPAFDSPRAAYVAAPLLAILLLGTLFLVRPGGPALRGFRSPEQGAQPSPFVVPPGSARLGRPGMPGAGPVPVLPLPPSATAPGAPPLLEEVGSPGARVYRFTVESGGDETPIYLVVDESIDI